MVPPVHPLSHFPISHHEPTDFDSDYIDPASTTRRRTVRRHKLYIGILTYVTDPPEAVRVL